eukprot:Hpha_TRINITY_DN24799_c0_g1::TRINITY_DN24799_c0_g1_i1::g.110296::m.110296
MPPRTDSRIRRWDKGSRQQRIQVLSQFLQTHRNSTGAEIERDLGPSAMLFFTRMTAWLRLTYMLNYELSIQLSAISLFLQGQRFLTNFMEVGGIQTLLDIVCHRTKNKEDKQNALLILIHIANSGRVCRETICDDVGPIPEDRLRWAQDIVSFLGFYELAALRDQSPEARAEVEHVCAAKAGELRSAGHADNAAALETDTVKALNILTGNVPYSGADMLCEALLHETNEATLELFGSLFMALGQGNPRKRSLIDAGLLRVIREGGESAQLCAATTIRSLQMAKQGDNNLSVLASLSAADNKTPTPDFHLPTLAGPAAPPQAIVSRPVDEEDPDVEQLVDTLSRLLDSENVKLRFEGTEFLATAAQNDRLLPAILHRMCDYLELDGQRAATDFDDEAGFGVPPSLDDEVIMRRRRASGARVLGRILQWRYDRHHAGGPTGQQMQMFQFVVEVLEERKSYISLLRRIKGSDAKDIDTQRECASTLQKMLVLSERLPDGAIGASLFPDVRAVLLSVLPRDTVAMLEGREEFDIEYLRQLRDLLQSSDTVI